MAEGSGTLLSVGGNIINGFADLFAGFAGASASKQQAKYVKQRTKAEIARARREFNAVQGQARTQIAKSGLDQQQGSALDVLIDNATEFGRDVGQLKFQGKVERQALKYQAKQQMWGGIFNAVSSWLGAGDTLLGSGEKPNTNPTTNPTQPTQPAPALFNYSPGYRGSHRSGPRRQQFYHAGYL